MAEPRICSVDGCDKPHYAKGWCQRHYYNLRPMPKCSVADCNERSAAAGLCSKHYFHAHKHSRPICSVDGCDAKQYAKGLCAAHYTRQKRNGNPLGGRRSHGEAAEWLVLHVRHTGDDCLIWPFNRNRFGYATVGFDGRERIASEVMCTLAHEPKPSAEHEAAHSCGKGRSGCVNPQHLRWATRVENEADKLIHGTHNRGERCGTAKLTENDVIEIRAAKGVLLQRELAEHYGVSQGTVSAIQSLKRWSWL